MIFWQKAMCVFGISVALAACSTAPQVTTTQKFAESVDTPYENILVIFLADKFDSRRYLETEVVKILAENGTHAVASTSMMDSRTPKTRQTFVAMVDDIGADAVLVTQIANLQSEGTVVDMNPESTYNFRPTYYYNVWSVELTEYSEPQAVDFEHSLALATQLYSVSAEDVVWAIEAKSNIKQAFDKGPDYSIYIDEAKAITSSLRKDGLISK
jgi:hypothetical protein